MRFPVPSASHARRPHTAPQRQAAFGRSIQTFLLGVGFVLSMAVPGPMAAPARQSVTWTIDPEHSLAEFTVRHMLIANVKGAFDGPTGTVSFDPARMAETLNISASLKAATINTRNPTRDQDLKGSGFFDVTKFPAITFKSKSATAGPGGHLAVIGDLTMHGVKREVTLDVEGPTPSIKDLNGQVRAGATATTTVNRRDFGLLYNELLETGAAVVSDQVRINLEIEMTHR